MASEQHNTPQETKPESLRKDMQASPGVGVVEPTHGFKSTTIHNISVCCGCAAVLLAVANGSTSRGVNAVIMIVVVLLTTVILFILGNRGKKDGVQQVSRQPAEPQHPPRSDK